MRLSIRPLPLTVLFVLAIYTPAFSQLPAVDSITFNDQQYRLYPHELDVRPELPSPLVTDDGTEVVTVELKDGRFTLIPVTMEDGSPLHYSRRVEDVFGKDQQLLVDKGDFPTLAKTGLHSESELAGREKITDFPVSLITYIGRPERFSWVGFMAADEDILSVLIADNRLVRTLGFTHPRMAKPLFHLWNMVLAEIETGNWARFWDHISFVYYNDRKIAFTGEGGKGWQISIFQDEIQGRFNLSARCELTESEKTFLRERYSHLPPDQLAALEEKLTHIHFSEMAPYYIMRYGFYEGHTVWRPDPIAIAIVFGLKNLEAVDRAFGGNLYDTLTQHFTQVSSGKNE